MSDVRRARSVNTRVETVFSVSFAILGLVWQKETFNVLAADIESSPAVALGAWKIQQRGFHQALIKHVQGGYFVVC